MKKVILTIITMMLMIGCNNHPRDKTNLDDIIHCEFGQEYVDGYTTSSGREVDSYCRKSN